MERLSGGDTKQSVRRACLVRLGGMGDILLATPAARALCGHFDGLELDFIVGRGMRDALAGIPYIRRIVEFDKNGPDAQPAGFFRFLDALRRERYDLFLNFHPSVKTVLMATASRAPRVITFRKDRRRQPDTGRVRHGVDDFTKELRPLGIKRVEDRRLDFFVPPEAHRRVAEMLQAERIAPGDTLVTVNPAATRDINRWPPDKFVGFFDTFAAHAPDVRFALSGGPGDLDLAADIAGRTRASVVNFAGRVSIKELGALLARSNVVVSADTGPMHIASAVGAPLVVLSGAADPDRTGPLNPRDLVVIKRDLPCVPCQGRFCRRGDIACMTQMPVEWVVRAVKRRLDLTLRPTTPGHGRHGLAGARPQVEEGVEEVSLEVSVS